MTLVVQQYINDVAGLELAADSRHRTVLLHEAVIGARLGIGRAGCPLQETVVLRRESDQEVLDDLDELIDVIHAHDGALSMMSQTPRCNARLVRISGRVRPRLPQPQAARAGGTDL